MPDDQSDTAGMDSETSLKGAARIGSELRGVRERLGWKLSDVADGLRIRLPYLEAIERGELSALPGAAYQTGFVRTYAQALGLDPAEILRRFRAEGLGETAKAELSFLAPVPDRAVPTGAIVLLGVVLLLAGYGFWYHHTEKERQLAAAVPSVPAELAPLALPKPVATPAPVMVKPAAPPAPVSVPVAGDNAAAPAAAPAAAATAPPAVPIAPGAPAAPAAAAAMAPATMSPAPDVTASAAAAGQVIMATADSWIEVQDPAGNILFSKVLHAGESWPVPNIAGLTMTAGNAGATEISTNGTAGAPLGAMGAVVHNYALTPPSPAAPAASPAPPAASQPATTN